MTAHNLKGAALRNKDFFHREADFVPFLNHGAVACHWGSISEMVGLKLRARGAHPAEFTTGSIYVVLLPGTMALWQPERWLSFSGSAALIDQNIQAPRARSFENRKDLSIYPLTANRSRYFCLIIALANPF